MFKYIVSSLVTISFFIGSDYPHAEGFVHPVEKAREYLKDLPMASVEEICSKNARDFYCIQ
jgi:hypothetical protein